MVLLQRYLINKILFICMVMASFHAYAATDIETIDDFQHWVASQVLCQSDEEIPVTSQSFIKQIKALGFELALEVDAESKVYEGTISISNTSIKTLGFVTNKIEFESDSGRSFSAYVTAKPRSLVDLIKHKGLAKYPLNHGIEDIGKFVFLTSPATSHNPYGAKQQAIVINPTEQQGVSTIACKVLDY